MNGTAPETRQLSGAGASEQGEVVRVARRVELMARKLAKVAGQSTLTRRERDLNAYAEVPTQARTLDERVADGHDWPGTVRDPGRVPMSAPRCKRTAAVALLNGLTEALQEALLSYGVVWSSDRAG